MFKMQAVTVSGYQMYRTVITELRAWVDNPCYTNPGEPVYYLCEIVDASRAAGTASVRRLDEQLPYTVPFSQLHTVHTFHVVSERVTKIHGEPKPCTK